MRSLPGSDDGIAVETDQHDGTGNEKIAHLRDGRWRWKLTARHEGIRHLQDGFHESNDEEYDIEGAFAET